MENINNTFYDCRWSNEVDEKFIKDYCVVQDTVFQNNYSYELFNKKFIANIYGPSIIIVVYDKNRAIGARSFWRNDIGQKEAYQPGDVCVLNEYRGKGIFTEMTKKAFAMLPEDAIIYTFPNSNSFPAHLKMGNKLVASYRPTLFTNKEYQKEHTLLLDEEYANWWLASRKDIKHIKRGNHFYLVIPYGLPMMYMVLAEVKQELAMQYKQCNWGIFFYRSTKISFYNKNKRPLYIVCKEKSNINYIPTWKVDSIGY